MRLLSGSDYVTGIGGINLWWDQKTGRTGDFQFNWRFGQQEGNAEDSRAAVKAMSSKSCNASQFVPTYHD